jgi:hypothetical protein
MNSTRFSNLIDRQSALTVDDIVPKHSIKLTNLDVFFNIHAVLMCFIVSLLVENYSRIRKDRKVEHGTYEIIE